jgi:hypothetical protein
MPFPIDVSHPFRYPSELRRLVEAVRRAGGYDETRWIEWKRTLDLTEARSIRRSQVTRPSSSAFPSSIADRRSASSGAPSRRSLA